MFRSLMIQGTGSGVGKSLIVMALCRIFNDRGVKVAPFKAQNMALNSFITIEGGEIGRAQALQAEAARTEPTIHMNPILLKASGDMGSQVILQGKVHSNMKAKEYYLFREEGWAVVKESFDRLASMYELIILEGAGSPAEINLAEVDIVNMRSAEYAKAAVLLVGDIDRGGVFASLYGTLKLVGRHSKRIKGFVINKFRGDIDILRPGLQMIHSKTGRPVIGVLPYLYEIGLPEEDGLCLRDSGVKDRTASKELRVVIVRLRYISNFTDFDPLRYEPDVEVIYSDRPEDIENADMVILPGTKNTVKDLLYLRQRGIEDSIIRAYKRGIDIVGICGGYQMLGRFIRDPFHVESDYGEVSGIGLLETETVFNKTKTTCQLTAEVLDRQKIATVVSDYSLDGKSIRGYEIHMGETKGDVGLFLIKRLNQDTPIPDGSCKGNCWGTYIHGIFDNDHLRRAVLNRLRQKKGLSPLATTVSYAQIKDQAINQVASLVRENLDMDYIERLIGL